MIAGAALSLGAQTTITFSAGAGSAVAAQEAQKPTSDSGVKVVDFKKPGDVPLTELLKTEAAKATKAGMMPVVEFAAEWCGPCKKIAASLGDARMIDAFSKVYIIRLDLDAWKPKLADAGFTNVSGIPAFFPINAEGRPTGATITGAAWGEDIPENMAPPLKKFFEEQRNKGATEKAKS